MATKELSINEEIKAAQLRVIDDDGSQLGIMKRRDALDLAMQKGLDLVEIAPTAQVPVCRIMDYGKYKFDKSKKEKETKKKQVIIETKEIQLSCRIGEHDFNTKLNHARRFINEGNKIKICLEFNKGREMAHIDLGYKLLQRFEEACGEFSVVEKRPIREGRRIIMFIGPKKVAPIPKKSSAVSDENQKGNSDNLDSAESSVV